MTRATDRGTDTRDLPLREIRLAIPDPQSPEVRRRIAEEVARLSPADEEDAINWIESVSEFDEKPEDGPSAQREGARGK